MGYSRQDALRMLAEIEGNLGSARGRLSELKRCLLSLDLDEKPDDQDQLSCGWCGVSFTNSELGHRKREEHLRNVHGYESALIKQRLSEELAKIEKAE